jgi:hypothetical protein
LGDRSANALTASSHQGGSNVGLFVRHDGSGRRHETRGFEGRDFLAELIQPGDQVRVR